MDVSIIIPTYNRLWCLSRALESCRGAECATEIIIVDDGSTDGTWEWLQAQTGIISIRQKNQGQTYAINAGTAIATGKYIRFLDSDDFLENGTIDLQFNKAETDDADLVYGRVDTYLEENEAKISHSDIIPWDDFMEVQLGVNYGSHFLGMQFRTAWLKKIPRRPDFALREDRMFLLEYCLLQPKISFVPGNMGYWVKHPQQMQGNYGGLVSHAANWQHLNIFKKVIAQLNEQGSLTTDRIVATSESLWKLAVWIGRQDVSSAIEVIRIIKVLNPKFDFPSKGIQKILYNTFGYKNTFLILNIKRNLMHFFS